MSFREKIAWAAFLTTLLAWGGYFAVVVTRGSSDGGHHDPLLFWLFLAAVLGQAVMMTALATVMAILTPREANLPRDERDIAVDRRASGIAYLVVMIGIVGIVVWLHIGLHGTGTIFALAALFIVGEAVRFGAQALGYRVGN
jgi:hypothetical protein